MKLIENTIKEWEHGLGAPSKEGLGLFRILFGLFVLFILSPGHTLKYNYSFLGSLPDGLFTPPVGVFALLDGFYDPVFFLVIHILIYVFTVGVLVGYRTKISSRALTVLFLVGNGFFYSLGKVDHDMLFVILPFIMSFSNWGARFSVDERLNIGEREVKTFPIMVLGVFVGFMMFTAGLPKILGGWLDPNTSAVYGRVVTSFFEKGRGDLLASSMIYIDNKVFWELFDYSTIIFEIGLLVSLRKVNVFRAFIVIGVLFHYGVLMMMNISFAVHIIVYAAFIDWGWVYNKYVHGKAYTRALIRFFSSGSPQLILRYTFVIGILISILGSPLLILNDTYQLSSGVTAVDIIFMSLSSVIAVLGFSYYLLDKLYEFILMRFFESIHPKNGS